MQRSTSKVLFYVKKQSEKSGQVPVMGRITKRHDKEKVDKDEAEVLFWQKMPESFDKRSKTPWARTTQGMSSDNC